MGAPKSVVKLSRKEGKTNIEYTSSVDTAQYYIYELTRAALRDVGKFVKKDFQTGYMNAFSQHSKAGGKSTSYSVISGKNTTVPRVQVGLSAKTQKGFYGYMQEFGSSHTKRYGLLQATVNENIGRIQEIEAQYLSALNGDGAEGLISESDYEEIE